MIGRGEAARIPGKRQAGSWRSGPDRARMLDPNPIAGQPEASGGLL